MARISLGKFSERYSVPEPPRAGLLALAVSNLLAATSLAESNVLSGTNLLG
jgi:hypothetical protein